MEHTLFIWSVPSSSDSSMSVNLTGAQPKLYLAVWPQQLLPNPQRAMCVNGGALMWKLFICYDTENIHKYHNNILYLLLGPLFFFFFFFHKWRDVASSVSAFRETCYFFKKRLKKISNRVSDSSVAILVVIMIPISTSRGKSLKCCLMPWRASSLMETGV